MKRLLPTVRITTSRQFILSPPPRRNMASQQPKEAKKELRSDMKAKLSALDEKGVMAQSRKAQNLILQHPRYQQAKRVGIYLSMPKAEAQTDGLVPDALWTGKKVFVPYIYSVGETKPKAKVMDMLCIEHLIEYGALERDSWGIPKLSSDGLDERENAMGGKGLSFAPDGTPRSSSAGEDAEGLDLIVVPGVAFDRNMNRTGHGAGFYDKFLNRFCEGGRRKKPYLSMSIFFSYTASVFVCFSLISSQSAYAWRNKLSQMAHS